MKTKLDPQFGFGVMYYSDRYYIGISTPKLLRTEFFETDSLAFVSSPGQRPHYFLSGGYVFDLGTYTKFKPTFLVKAVQGAPLSFDLSANFLFYEKFWLGAMYRHEDAVGAMLQYHINNDLTVGYAYDYPLSTLRNYSGGSHEIMLGFAFGNKTKGVRSPRYF
ncbi:MAG: PorP/SprF family type IX secretion system membrane protein [Flavobacteriales bacterium]